MGWQHAPDGLSSAAFRQAHEPRGLGVRHSAECRGRALSAGRGEYAVSPAGGFDFALLSARLYPTEAEDAPVHAPRRFPGGHAYSDRLGWSFGQHQPAGLVSLCHPLSLAVSPFSRYRLDVSRRLQPRGVSHAARIRSGYALYSHGDSGLHPDPGVHYAAAATGPCWAVVWGRDVRGRCVPALLRIQTCRIKHDDQG